MDFLQYTLAGYIRAIRLKLSGKQLLIQGSCHQCGKCCQSINIQTQYSWLRSIKKLRALRTQNPLYRRLQLIGRTADGLLLFTCKSLKDGKCTTYESRFSFCKSYPEPKVFFMGCVFQKGCGYSLAEGKPFEKHLTEKLESVDTTHINHNDHGDIVLPSKK